MSDPRPNHAAISLGSNIRPVENLQAAVRELAKFVTLLKASRVWESAPVGFADQPNFLNAAVLIETPLSAADLKRSVLSVIEDKLHRVRDPHNVNAPRTIDLDLSIIITPSESRVLDEEILSRNFVTVPLAEILPEFRHPQTGQTLAEIAAALQSLSPPLQARPDCDLGRFVSPGL